VVLVGDTWVGKTCIVNRFLQDRVNPDEPNAVGRLYLTSTGTGHGQDIDLQIWDTAETEQYRSSLTVYFRNAIAALIVYDITNRDSFANLETGLKTFRTVAIEKVGVIIVGNQKNLSDNRKAKKAKQRSGQQNTIANTQKPQHRRAKEEMNCSSIGGDIV
jgi:small GTP-binding protein